MLRVIKIIAVAWCIISAGIALAGAIWDFPPASFFLHIPVGPNTRLSLQAVFIFTWLLLVLVVFPPLLLYNFIIGRRNRKNNLSSGQKDLSGIVVKRNKALPDAMFPFEVLIDGEIKAKVPYGGSVFLQLKPGNYEMMVRIGSKKSAPHTVTVKPAHFSKYELDINTQGYKFFAPKQGYIEIVPVLEGDIKRD